MADNERQLPLYQQIKDALKDEIATQRYDPAKPFITQRELCERFGVSTITAVRALNDLVAEGVLVRRRGQGTFVAERAERPARRQDTTIACIVHGLHGLSGAHVSHILTGVESACSDLGYQLVLANSAESAEREEGALKRALNNGASGIVLYPVQGQSNPDIFAEIRRRRVPLVMIDRYRADVATDAVVADNTDLGYRVTKKLAERGHARIATLWGETECTSVRDRMTGHLQALHQRELPVLPELTVLRPYESLPEKQRTAMIAELLDGPNPPSVFLCANGYVLAAAAHDLLSLGVHVPDEVDLACMDDAGPYDLLPLAAVAGILPSAEMAVKAMELLAERIGGADSAGSAPPTRRVILPISVREREGAAGHLRTVSTPRT
ncbi:MAG TPA: GntR family transcriptional regulator [Mycobacteriales bacterium]|jgi:DNA-binding LacI/PurR family transcriptional regulator|nr:GntR family transcriptional regulator [Mycobacteriales bacterium]